jgi:hypothetical protein
MNYMQPSTTVVNLKRTSEYDVRICRDGRNTHMNNTEVGEDGWIGNPYPEGEYGRQKCIKLFRQDFEKRLDSDDEFREAVEGLRGKTLACYCKPKDCHGDIIVSYLHGSEVPDW